MNSLPTRRTFLVVATIMVAACAVDRPTAPPRVEPGGVSFARPSAVYTSTDIGSLISGLSSWAYDVNNDGEVVGTSCCDPERGTSAFAVLGGALVSLPGGVGGDASGISNGNPRYVVGSAGFPPQPVRWTIAGGTPSAPTDLALMDDELTQAGAALGVNDAGAAVGRVGNRAAMWSDAGARTSIPAPEGFVHGEGRDLNNSGEAVFVFFDSFSELAGARAYLRLTSGVLIELPPLPGDVTSYANAVSDVSNNAVYIAGTTRTSRYVFRGLRWTVDVSTGAILGTEVRSENSHTLGVSDAGATAGFLETNAERTPRLTPFLWRGSEFRSLKPPKGASQGHAWAMSANGRFVAGDGYFGLQRRAVLWTILSP